MSSAFEGLPKTPNLKLNKPGYDNVADIEALNENADILDEEIQGIKNTFVKSVNGKEPDAGGNVNVEEYTHPNSGVTAGTYSRVTVNAQGHVTGGSNPTLSTIPAGTIIAYGGTSIPSGYLQCNGAAVSRTTYSALWSAIGTTYGSGDGSTTFNLPNLSTNLISNVSTGNLQVKGNGITLGLTNGTNNYGLSDARSGTLEWSPLVSNDKAYGKAVGGTTDESSKNRVSFMGITTDGSKSGMIVPMSATKTTVKYIIKY